MLVQPSTGPAVRPAQPQDAAILRETLQEERIAEAVEKSVLATLEKKVRGCTVLTQLDFANLNFAKTRIFVRTLLEKTVFYGSLSRVPAFL